MNKTTILWNAVRLCVVSVANAVMDDSGYVVFACCWTVPPCVAASTTLLGPNGVCSLMSLVRRVLVIGEVLPRTFY